MASHGIKYSYNRGEFATGMGTMEDPIADAATAAIADVGLVAKISGRASIAAGGFSLRWQNAYRLILFPKFGKKSIDASAYLVHNIPYSLVFETGAVLRGRPLMYIPLKTTPQKIGTRRTTPKVYEQLVGPLFPVRRAGKPILLMGTARVPRGRRPGTKITLAQLKRGGSNAPNGPRTREVAVPLFFGLATSTIRKRFDTTKAASQAAAQLPQRFAAHLKVD